MTQRGAAGNVLGKKKNLTINPADAPFLERAGSLSCLVCQARLFTCVSFHSLAPWLGGAGAPPSQTILMRRALLQAVVVNACELQLARHCCERLIEL